MALIQRSAGMHRSERERERSAGFMRMKTSRLVAVPLATTRHTNTHAKEKSIKYNIYD